MESINIKTVLVLVAISAVSGALGGYFAASFSPVPGQIAIVDIQGLVIKASSKGGQTEEEARTITAKVKQVTDSLVEQGIVVIDSQYVLSAPEEAYVSIE